MDIKSKERSTSNPSLVCDKSRKSVIPDETFHSSSNSLVSPRATAHVENVGTDVDCIKLRNEMKDDVSVDKITVIEPTDKVSNFSYHLGFTELECDERGESFPAPDDNGQAVSPCEPPKQSSHLSTQASGIFGKLGKDFSPQLKQQIREIIPNGIYSEPSLSYTPNVVSNSSSKLESSPLSCISVENLFDPALVTPSVGILGLADDQFPNGVASSDFKSFQTEGEDVCQKLLTDALHSEHERLKSSQQRHSVEAETPKYRSAFSVAGLTDFGSGSEAVSEMQLNTQGLKDICAKPTVAKVQTLNGISTLVHSSKSEALSAISMLEKCSVQSSSIIRDVTLHSDSDKSSCGKTVHSISRTNSIADETVSTQNPPVNRVLCHMPLSPADHNRHILRATESEKENARRTKPVGQGYDRQACLTVTQTSDLDKLNKTIIDDISPVFPSMKGKAPKAKKSCGISAKGPPVFCENSEFSVLRQRAGDASTSVAGRVADDVVSIGSISRPALSSMTIKLPELENVLGIGYKSLDKMDAKTLDRIVLAKAQKKQRLETGSHPRTSESSDQSSIGRNFSVKDRIENPLPLSDNETTSGIRRQRNNHLCEKTNAQRLLPVSSSHVDRSSVDAESLKYSRQRNFGSINTETAIEATELTSAKDSVDRSKFSGVFSEKSEASVGTNASDQRNRNSLNFLTRPICKAKKSQGYAFGHVRHCQDILNASTKSPFDLGSATIRPSSSLSAEAFLNPAKDDILANQNKARKQASSYQHPLNHNASDYSSSGDKKIQEKLNVRLGRKRKVYDRSLSPESRCLKSKQMLMSSGTQSISSIHASNKSSVLRMDSEAANDHGKQFRIETASVSSSSLADGCATKLPRKSADKMSLPVTPPQSPGGCSTHTSDASSLVNSVARGPSTLKCCCEETVDVDNKHLLLCQALDSVDGKVVGCTRRWTNGKMVRPSARIPFMALCAKHFGLLTEHSCCPGCGLFCIQGEFYQCRQSSCGKLHSFHRHCQVYRDERYLCPHCGNESIHESVVLQMDRSLSMLSMDGSTCRQSNKSSRTARLGSCCSRKGPKSEGSSSAKLSDESVLFGLNPLRLEMMISSLSAVAKEKMKKIRICAKSFFTACKSGEIDRVLYMIGEGIDPNLQQEDFSESYLHVAARHGHEDVVKLLLQAGSLPNLLDISLRTPLMVAAVKGHLKVLEVLLQAGASPNYRATDGMTVLHLAAKAGQLDIIRFLVENYRLDVNVKDDGGWTPVIWATEYTHIATVRYLLKMRANPNFQDNELNTGLHWAAYAGSTEIAKMFLDAGCDLECSNERGDRPIHIAGRQNHYECVAMFLMRGADTTAVNRAGQTPLDCCTVKESSTRMNLALKKQLMESPAFLPARPERLVHEDVSLGRESIPITVVSSVNGDAIPADFVYVSDYVETIPININRVITSLRACDCRSDCSDFNCNCLRNSLKCWYDKNGRLIEEFSYQDPPLLYECNRACRCHATCQNRVIQNGITCRLQVFRTKGRGWGCRTLLHIARGSFVCEYFGELISDAEAERRQDDSYLFDLDNQETDTFCVDAAKYGNVSRFINHLCEPNITPVKVFVDHQDLRFPRMCFFANRDIRANEELGFDYGEKFWVIKYKDFTCECGSSNCRYSVNTIGKTLEDFRRRQEEDSGPIATDQ